MRQVIQHASRVFEVTGISPKDEKVIEVNSAARSKGILVVPEQDTALAKVALQPGVT